VTSNTKLIYGMTGYDEVHLTHYISMILVVELTILAPPVLPLSHKLRYCSKVAVHFTSTLLLQVIYQCPKCAVIAQVQIFFTASCRTQGGTQFFFPKF